MPATLRFFNVRSFLALLLLALLAVIGGNLLLVQPKKAGSFWTNSTTWGGVGPKDNPNCDSGDNWMWWLRTPNGDICLRGAVSDQRMDQLLNESEAYDSSGSWVQKAFDFVKGWLEDEWNGIPPP